MNTFERYLTLWVALCIIVGIGLVALLIWRPKGALKLAKNGMVSWRTLRLIRRLLA